MEDGILRLKRPLLQEGCFYKTCFTRIPYATLVATLMCLAGVGIFCGTMYRGASLTIIMLNQTFHLRLLWIETVQMTFVVIGASMAALSCMILFVGFLTTGATRHKVYREWRSRVGGRISCAVLIGIAYAATIIWIFVFGFLIVVTFIYTVFRRMCTSVEVSDTDIDLSQFHFMFPSNIHPDEMKVNQTERKGFCKDAVENCEIMFVLSALASFLVVLSLVQYLMCLSANYAHIRDHEKLQELQDLQNLNEIEFIATSKNRPSFSTVECMATNSLMQS